ncbi:hypothetical protein Taro_033001 [Colocasia esculenta]|uniref:Uncharacterized protein n=1 Tax=Colocasia esculenta TaxID=4460 RepID=A0A843VSS1_COLES|nr:hypothetical protein [Colocasia esculenta]
MNLFLHPFLVPPAAPPKSSFATICRPLAQGLLSRWRPSFQGVPSPLSKERGRQAHRRRLSTERRHRRARLPLPRPPPVSSPTRLITPLPSRSKGFLWQQPRKEEEVICLPHAVKLVGALRLSSSPRDPLAVGEAKTSLQVSGKPQTDQQSNPGSDATTPDSAGASTSGNGNSKKVSREDIELVQNLIERCLLLYMNKNEVVGILKSRAKIEPGFTSLVWQKLEEENAEFFRAYYIRLKLKKQILLFNNLLEHQYHLMRQPAMPKVPLVPIQNGVHSMSVNNVPMGYPVIQQPAMPATGQPNFDALGISSCHVVNGVPAPGNFHPVQVNSGNDAMSSMSDMAVSPTSVASNGHFPFPPSDMSGIGMDSTVLDSAFTSDMGTTGGLQLGIDAGAGTSKDALRSGGQLTWNFSFPDLAAEFTNLDDLGVFGSYTGSPFLPEADMTLDADQDGMEDFFVDDIDEPSSPSDEEKP